MRVAPRGGASAIDKRVGALPRATRFVRAAAARPQTPASAKLRFRDARKGRRELEILRGPGDSIGGKRKLCHSDWLSSLRGSQSRVSNRLQTRHGHGLTPIFGSRTLCRTCMACENGFQTRNIAKGQVHDSLSYRLSGDTKSFSGRESKSCSCAVRVDVHIRRDDCLPCLAGDANLLEH